MLEIKALGDLTIVKDGDDLQDVGSAKARAIRAHITLEGETHSRRDLATLFWPESTESHANSSLRVALSALRKFADDYVNITHKTVAIYLEVIKRWLEDYKDRLNDIKMKEDEMYPLDTMVENELEKYRSMDFQ